jgi:hypothetical protein
VIFAIGVLLWFAIDWLIFGLMINGCPQDCAFSDFPQQHDTIMFFSIMAALYAADWVILRAGDEFVSAGT